MSALGGIGQQVAGDIFELGKSIVKGTAKAAGDIVGDTLETALRTPLGAIDKPNDSKNLEQGKIDSNRVAIQKRQNEKKQFEEVREELAEYTQRKKQQEAQIFREKNQEEQEYKQKEDYEKQKKESFLQKLMKNLARGSHGESDRQKE